MKSSAVSRGIPVCVLALLCAAGPEANAFEADPVFTTLPYTAGFDATAAAGEADSLTARLSYVIERAGILTSRHGDTLLPAGTVLDALEIGWDGIAQVGLSSPAEVDWTGISSYRVATIEHVLARTLAEQTELAGISIHVRTASGAYAPIHSFIIPFTPPADSKVSDDTGRHIDEILSQRALATTGAKDVEPEGVELIGGPAAHADGQPSGALSGVVVFVSAGHGWTAGASSWYLQRPLLFDMIEDYGNLDQLNYFINYLYNAGAVVVPFRPVGNQTTEIVLDNDDPGVTFSGSWSDSTTTSGYYENGATVSGVPYRFATASVSETATARYTPTIPQTDFYPVYCWTKDDVDRVNQTYRVHHSGGTAEVTIDHTRVGKGWIWLGIYHFEAGTDGYVEITNASPDSGVVIADAIRFGNGIGDIVRPGPGTVSGYPREEECSRYWAESEAGNNAVGLPSVWECSGCDDGSDNVGTAARWAAVMNRDNVNADRWRRVYVEWHTNAAGCAEPPCGAKGTLCLVSSTAPTTYQTSFATILGDKIEADMIAIDDQFEFTWGARSNPYYGGYGAISTYNNDNEFDATIIELAFHDDDEDAANLRSVKVRDAAARSAVQGVIMFLNTLPGSGVPLAFLPDPPEQVQAVRDANGDVLVSWTAPPSGGASGGPATGYKVYRSTNGYGFGNAVIVGNQLSVTLTDIPDLTTTYLRVTATNAGGESMPSETLAVRPSEASPANVLIVNGYDRVSRHQNYVQTIPLGPFERQIARYVNSFDYVVQHAEALASDGRIFDSCSNEAVIQGAADLKDYSIVVWILGQESDQDHTFDLTEQLLVGEFLSQGGRLFATGTDIGWDLVEQGNGSSFYENMLGGDYLGDDSGSTSVAGTGGVLGDLGTFSIDPSDGAPYAPRKPDRFLPQFGGTSIAGYVGGTADGAGIQFETDTHRVVMFGFPFETIATEPLRADVMQRVMSFLETGAGPGCGKTMIANFEGYPNLSRVVFRLPRYSTVTQGHLVSRPNVAYVSDDIPGFDGLKSYLVSWRWVSADPFRWLLLTTENTDNLPNPALNLRRPVRIRLRLDSGSFRLALGIRETGQDVPIGEDGGTVGPIEWLGADSVIGDAPQGVLVTAQPGVWQTITFEPRPELVLAYTGDGVLSAPHNMGVLEHLAISINDTAGPISVYLDAIEQPCFPVPDFDEDGDVDEDDYTEFVGCASGPSIPVAGECIDKDLDWDGDADQSDFGYLQRCFSGPGVPYDPSCAD